MISFTESLLLSLRSRRLEVVGTSSLFRPLLPSACYAGYLLLFMTTDLSQQRVRTIFLKSQLHIIGFLAKRRLKIISTSPEAMQTDFFIPLVTRTQKITDCCMRSDRIISEVEAFFVPRATRLATGCGNVYEVEEMHSWLL